MRTLHTIRLRGPWGCQPLARFVPRRERERDEATDDLPPVGRLTMPSDWAPICGTDFRGRVRFRRRFHWPTRLTPRERVWLVFDNICGTAAVELNGQALGGLATADAPAEFDITALLEPTNILVVDVTSPEHDERDGNPGGKPVGGITGEVRLEIRLTTSARGSP